MNKLLVMGVVVSHLLGSNLQADSTSEKTIVKLVQNDKNFSTLAQAIKTADLVATLEGKGPFTLFAPTNAAFAHLPPGQLQNLLKPENKEKLIAFLNYHVVPGKTMAADLRSGTLKTVNGKNLDIQIHGAETKINNAHLMNTDIIGSNGVIQVIDAVLIP